MKLKENPAITCKNEKNNAESGNANFEIALKKRLNDRFRAGYFMVKRTDNATASGTKLMSGIISSSGFQSREIFSGTFANL